MTWQQTIDEEKDIAFEEGKVEGFEEGMKQGIECGIGQGIERGEEKKALESAENLLREGDSPEKVARCIGLPLERVKQIAQSLSVKA